MYILHSGYKISRVDEERQTRPLSSSVDSHCLGMHQNRLRGRGSGTGHRTKHGQKERKNKASAKVDESGIEPETSPMLRERATNYATRPSSFTLTSVLSPIFHPLNSQQHPIVYYVPHILLHCQSSRVVPLSLV